MAARVNLYIDQGTDFYTTLQLESANSTYNITDEFSFYCSVKKLYSTSKLFDANVSIIAGDPANDISITITGEQTKDLNPGKYQYDVIMIDDNNSVEKILEGLLFIVETITRVPT